MLAKYIVRSLICIRQRFFIRDIRVSYPYSHAYMKYLKSMDMYTCHLYNKFPVPYML